MQKLKTALRFNALASFLTGVIAIAFAAWLSGSIGLLSPYLIQCFGVILCLHGVALMAICTGGSLRNWARLNFALIAPYPFLLIALVALGFVSTRQGTLILCGDALLVAMMAVWQAAALRKLH